MIFYITTCSKREKYAKEVKKYFEGTGVEYFFVYGKDQTSKIEPYVEVDCEDSYENLPMKTFLSIKHFIETGRGNLFVKIDDDTYLDLSKVKQMAVKADYTGPFVPYIPTIHNKLFHWFKVKDSKYKVKKKTFDLSYAEGSFYILSKKACNTIINKGIEFFVNTPETYLGEDVKIGMCLLQNDITKEDITKIIVPHYESAADFLFIHPVHYLLFSKLKNCNSTEETKTILTKFLCLNDNIAREAYLNGVIENKEHE